MLTESHRFITRSVVRVGSYREKRVSLISSCSGGILMKIICSHSELTFNLTTNHNDRNCSRLVVRTWLIAHQCYDPITIIDRVKYMYEVRECLVVISPRLFTRQPRVGDPPAIRPTDAALWELARDLIHVNSKLSGRQTYFFGWHMTTKLSTTFKCTTVNLIPGSDHVVLRT